MQCNRMSVIHKRVGVWIENEVGLHSQSHCCARHVGVRMISVCCFPCSFRPFISWLCFCNRDEMRWDAAFPFSPFPTLLWGIKICVLRFVNFVTRNRSRPLYSGSAYQNSRNLEPAPLGLLTIPHFPRFSMGTILIWRLRNGNCWKLWSGFLDTSETSPYIGVGVWMSYL